MRPALLNPVFRPVESLPGVGPRLAQRLERLGVKSVRDLLFHLPVGWHAVRPIAALEQGREGERVRIALALGRAAPGHGRAPTLVPAHDSTGERASLAFFGAAGAALARRLGGEGETVTLDGRLDRFQGGWRIAHPERVAADAPLAEAAYPLTAGLTSRQVARLVRAALEALPPLDEWADTALVRREHWPAFGPALAQAHGSAQDAPARERLAYDEALAVQLSWALGRRAARRRPAWPVSAAGRLARALLASLPFQPTGAQLRSRAEIAADMAEQRPMLRLLQGDTGSGKTLVAALAMADTVEAGHQAVLLAPTELLARQHHATLGRWFGPLGHEVALLTGRLAADARRAAVSGLGGGGARLAVGTHALIGDEVALPDLALAVVDEQHRFGVAQRMMLSAKGQRAAHLLVMTATPIPRTLALAQFGETCVSRLDERPAGRRPVATRVIACERLEEVIAALGRHKEGGGQAYWVCPTLETMGEDEGPASALARAAELASRLGAAAVELVHGRMPVAERERAMERFAAGEARVLVATTVIEVGVDVPAASLMVIEGADRFGLAQLHQLRGRVGRGSAESHCWLLAPRQPGATARQRLAMLRATDDGFAIAEADLGLRGAGELLGTRQSGEPGLWLASAEAMTRWTAVAEQDARLLAERDPGLTGPRGEAARALLYLFDRDQAVATLRGA